MHNGNTRPPALCAGEAPDEKLKINELGPYVCTHNGHWVGWGPVGSPRDTVLQNCAWSCRKRITQLEPCRKVISQRIAQGHHSPGQLGKDVAFCLRSIQEHGVANSHGLRRSFGHSHVQLRLSTSSPLHAREHAIIMNSS